MKLNKFFMGILGAMALSACSSEEPVTGGDTPNIGEGETRYMSVTIRNANMGTRADNEPPFEAGYEAENIVNSLRFYFFKENGDPAPVKFNGDSYYDCKKEDIKPGEPNQDMPNVESILNAVIVINTNTNEGSRNDIKQMVAVVNFDGVKEALSIGKTNSEKPNNLTLDELTNIINDEAAARKNGFLMTSSTFYDNGNSIAVEIKESDIKSSEELAKTYPVDVYVERVLAKVRVTQAWDPEKVDVVTGVSFDGHNDCIAVALKDANKNPILVGNTPDSPQAYVIFRNWDLWWTTDKSNLFKKVDDWDAVLGWSWNDPNFKRSYWAENPDGVKLAKHPHSYPSRKIGKGTDKDYADYTAYCLENAADNGNGGLKKWYDPANATTNRTLAYLAATIVTLDASKTKATPVDLAEWAGYKYTKESVLTAMFEPNVNEFYFLYTDESKNPPEVDENGNIIESGSTSYTYIPVKVSDLELVSAMNAGMATDDKEDSPRYQSFVNLISEKKGLWNDKTTEDNRTLPVVKKLYKKISDGHFKEVSVDEVNSQLESVGGAKVWDGGNTYYYQELKHLGKTGVDPENKPFGYGVVRNHIYEVELQSVTGLGTPVLNYKDENGENVWEDITPQKPTPDSYFLGARLNILSWRVVNNGTSLDW